MVQALTATVITPKDLHKPSTVNGVSESTAQYRHLGANGNMSFSPGPSQITIPIPIPTPLFTHQHHRQQRPFLQPLGPMPLLPTPNVPASVTALFPPQALTPRQSPLTQYNAALPDQAAQSYCEYLYHVGFIQGRFSDIAVSFPSLQKTFCLHALVLARSPKLFRILLNTCIPMLELDLGVSLKTVHTVVGHLYRPLSHQGIYSLVNEKLSIAAEMLDAAQELELDLLQTQLVHAIHQTMSQTSVMFWAEKIVERQQQHQKQQQQRDSWIDAVDHHVIHFLTRDLPDQLEAFTHHRQQQQQQQHTPLPKEKEDVFEFGTCSTFVHPKTGIRPGLIELAHVYAGLPVGYLKRCVEHSDLTDMVQRYHLAWQVVHCQEQMGKSELMVVLRFQGAEQGSEISIVKKQALGTGHWKPRASECVLGQ